MFTDSRQEQLFEKIKQYFKENKPDKLHDIDHIVRVIFWTKLLSEKEGVDSSITIPAAILHDIAIPKYGDEVHAREGAKMCKPILKECGYNDEEIEKIADTILMHSTDDPKPPETLEAKILFDADKLDTTGPIALHRWFFSYSNKGFLHHEALNKLIEHFQKWKKQYGDPPFFTKTGKEFGGPGIKYIEDTCKEILKDLEKFKEFYDLL